MRCACGFDNPEAARFCGWCGEKVANRCPRCRTENPLEFQFCGECGAALGSGAAPPRAERPIGYTPRHLAERILAEQAALESRAASDGERKTITALFADIQGSMDLLEGVDPEEARRIIDPALERMMGAVHRYEGYVAQSTGDGIFALFGAPIAHEDHPQRSLYAALRMQEEVRKYAGELRREKGVNLEIRVGINTGEVVLRSIRKDDLHTDYVPIGHSTGLAARMETLATPGSIVVTEHTERLTEGYFEFRALGPTRVKGASEPLNVYQLIGTGPLRTKLEMAARRGLTRFVGRQAEMAQLERALGLARSGRGQIVGVMGEPGVGKSRLLHEFKLAARSDSLLLEGFAVSHGKANPYQPLIEMLKTYFGLGGGDEEGRRREKIAAKAAALDRSLEDAVPHVFSLMGLLEAESPLHQMDPQIRRSRTFEALKRLFLRETRDQPVVVIVEDLHWIDGESEAFLAALGEAMAAARLLLLVNYRPEYEPRWGNKTYASQIRLDPLEEKSAGEMLAAMLGEEPELRPLQRLILEKSEGTPFFMEEIVRALFEAGTLVRNGRVRLTTSLAQIRIPPTVEGLLAARLDRLAPEEKELLQAAAVVGREFPLAVLGAVTDRPEAELRASLAKLQAAEFVYEQLAAAETQYIFKHALTREVAYQSLLVERRTALHERAARSIEALYQDRLEEHYGDLAHQYAHTRNAEKAVQYLELAGRQAAERSALAEAITHFTTALRRIEDLPDGVARRRQELGLRIALGPVLMANLGYGSPEVSRCYDRARDLCDTLGDSRDLGPVLFGLWAFHEIRAEYGPARALAERLLSLTGEEGDPDLLPDAYWTLGDTSFFSGDLIVARDHFLRGFAAYDPKRHRSQAFRFGQDPGVCCLTFLAWSQAILGYPDRARHESAEAVRMARELGHPFTLARAFVVASFVHQYRGEAAEAERFADSGIAFSAEWQLGYWGRLNRVLHGWAIARRGDHEQGVREIRESVSSLLESGTPISVPYFLFLLADALVEAGKRDEALDVVRDARALVEKNGERQHEAELIRLEGALSLGRGARASNAAEALFRRAIEVARTQQAKLFELRAATSLSRLLRDTGGSEEARGLLREVYGWFTEGFETADLKEAKALLESLSGEARRDVRIARGEDVFRKEGDYWTIASGGKVIRLKDARGLAYLAHLLRHPGVEFHATDLAVIGAGSAGGNGSAAAGRDASMDGRAGLGDAGEVLDARARAAYKQRLLDLREELEEAQARNDPGRAQLASAEIESITAELERGFGLGGRSRRAGSHAERARINVTRAIAGAVAKIRLEHPTLARYLAATVKTGTFCRYEADAQTPYHFVT